MMKTIVIIILGLLGYVGILALICLFLKGATKYANEVEDRAEVERVLKQLKEQKGKE